MVRDYLKIEEFDEFHTHSTIGIFRSTGTNTTIGGLNGLIEDVLALLPQDEIFMLFFEKLDSSPKFSAFVQSIGDPSFHRKYTTLWVNSLFRFSWLSYIVIQSANLIV